LLQEYYILIARNFSFMRIISIIDLIFSKESIILQIIIIFVLFVINL